MELLVAVFPAASRDAVIDALIATEAFSGFTLSPVDSFSRIHRDYDLHEQVAGYRHACRVEVLIGEERREALLALLEDACGSDRFQYWVSPVSAYGNS